MKKSAAAVEQDSTRARPLVEIAAAAGNGASHGAQVRIRPGLLGFFQQTSVAALIEAVAFAEVIHGTWTVRPGT